MATQKDRKRAEEERRLAEVQLRVAAERDRLLAQIALRIRRSLNQATLINRVLDHLPVISVDPAQLRRVFENLLSNAFNHNPPGISLTLDARVEEDMIRCTVADNGVGMSKEMCDHLFQLYFRGQDAQGHQGHRPYTGLGLGLYLCRQIIMAHDGELGVNSRQGVGTTFWFTLPLTSNQLSDRSY